MAAWRSPSRSSAAARGATLGSMAAWAGSRAGTVDPATSAARPQRTAARTQGRMGAAAGGGAECMYVNNANGLRSWLGPARREWAGPVKPELQRDVSVLPGMIPLPLGPKGPQGIDEARAGVPR